MSGMQYPPSQRPDEVADEIAPEELHVGDASIRDEVAGAGSQDAASIARAAMDAEAAATLGRRRWPLPKHADPHAPLLVVENLRTYFTLESGTVKAVDGVSFELHDGEALGIAGESGCGKTTTALSLVRILPSNAKIVEGSIKLMGIDLVGKSDNALRRYRWREISIVFQGAMNALNPVRRVRDQIAEPIEERLGESPEAARKRAGELLELVGIPRERGRPTRTNCPAGCASGP